MRFGLTFAIVLVLVSACQGDGEVPFRLHIVFGSGEGGPRECEQACDAYGLACGGTLGLRIADARDLEVAHYFNCVTVSPAEDLCSLGELDFTFGQLPAGPARIEVALWNPDALGEQRCMNEPFFDLQGEPLPVTPAPAVAGATFFDIGAEADVYVPMTCVVPAQLDRPECQE